MRKRHNENWEFVEPPEGVRLATRRIEVVQVQQAPAPAPEKRLPQWLTVEQALELLPISKASLYRHIREGRIMQVNRAAPVHLARIHPVGRRSR